MAAGGNFVAPLFRQGVAGNQDGGHVDALPTYQPPRELGADARYPLALVCPKPHAFMNSQYGNMAKQLAAAGRAVRARSTAPTPPARGIAAGDAVRVFNDRGEVCATARVTDDVAPGSRPVADGSMAGSRSTAGFGVNALTSTRYADIGRAPTFSDTAVAGRARSRRSDLSFGTGPNGPVPKDRTGDQAPPGSRVTSIGSKSAPVVSTPSPSRAMRRLDDVVRVGAVGRRRGEHRRALEVRRVLGDLDRAVPRRLVDEADAVLAPARSAC